MNDSLLWSVVAFIHNTFFPSVFLGSLLVFIVTSALWLFFKKAFKKTHYTALGLFAFALYFWFVVNLNAKGLHIGPPDYVYKTKLPNQDLLKTIYVTAWIFFGYTVIAWVVVLVRRLFHLPNKKLLLYILWVMAVCVPLILWQFVLPCEYTPIGCKVSTIIELPQMPQNY